MTTIDVFVTQH